MDVWNYILGYRNTLQSVFETWVVHIPFKRRCDILYTKLSMRVPFMLDNLVGSEILGKNYGW